MMGHSEILFKTKFVGEICFLIQMTRKNTWYNPVKTRVSFTV